MSDDDFDPELRRNVDALHAEADAPLGEDALARVIAAAQHEAARLARGRRLRVIAFGVSGALAAAAALLVWIGMQRQHGELVATPRSVPAECALPFGAAAPAFSRAADGRQQLSLGSLGQLTADATAALHIEGASACELSVRLERGVLAGDLSNLRPAVLRIQTKVGEVVVRGTRFSVAADDGLEVVLLSGTVDVVGSDRALVHLSPGKTLRKRSAIASMQVVAASPEHARRLDALLASAPAAPAAPAPAPAPAPAVTATDAGSALVHAEQKPGKSTADLLSAAEAERRRGKLPEARALYREAGARNDENAEVALLRWVRLELDTQDAQAARAVLKQYRHHFEHGRLGTEAAWLEVRTLSALGERDAARAAAERLIGDFPATPQAKAARQLLDGP